MSPTRLSRSQWYTLYTCNYVCPPLTFESVWHSLDTGIHVPNSKSILNVEAPARNVDCSSLVLPVSNKRNVLGKECYVFPFDICFEYSLKAHIPRMMNYGNAGYSVQLGELGEMCIHVIIELINPISVLLPYLRVK